jgi:hypothetical protein
VLTKAAAISGQDDSAAADAHLEDLLNQMSVLMANGETFPLELITLLRQAESQLDSDQVEIAFQNRLASIGSPAEVPDLDQILDQDHDGIVNNQDNCPHFYNPDQNPDDCNESCEPSNLQDSYACHDNAEWWVDDCGVEGSKKADCECGCADGNLACWGSNEDGQCSIP